MSTIHISIGGRDPSEYDEAQVRSMIQEGHLGADAQFWKPGMTDWRPVGELFSERPTMSATPPAIPEGIGAPGYTFTRNPVGLTQTLKVMLWVHLGVSAISMLTDFGQLSLASSENIPMDAAEANDARQGLIGILYLAVVVATGFTFLKWIYRANLNCRGFGASDMEFTPGWSIGYYFIPIMNLFRPFQVMKEIWNVSRDPVNWKAHRSSPLLGWWWALWILSGALGQICFRTSMNVHSPGSLRDATMASIVSTLSEFPLILVAITMISRIIRMQVQLTQRHNY
jgi:hypothetical protein